jgi:hypothetical protein
MSQSRSLIPTGSKLMSDKLILEEDFLHDYDANVFEKPNTSVDTVIFTVLNGELQVLLVKRAHHPFKDCWSLVGGFINLQEDDNLEETGEMKHEAKRPAHLYRPKKNHCTHYFVRNMAGAD